MTASHLSGPVLARLDRPRTRRPVRLAVIADPHVADGHGTWKVKHRSRERFRQAVAHASAADAAVIAGDLTGDGHPEEFKAVDRILEGLSVPWTAVPGNHDVQKAFDHGHGLSAAEFGRRYAAGSEPTASPESNRGWGSGSRYPVRMEVGPITVVGVNTASAPDGSLQDTWGGRVGPRDRAWLADVLPEIETPVVVLHHNVATLPENPGGKWTNFPTDDADPVGDLLVDAGVPLVVTAHHHVPAVVGHGPTVEVLAPATCSFPQAMVSVEIGPEGTALRYVPLTGRPGVAESYRLAHTGRPLGAGIATVVERRLAEMPLAGP